ncbi:MAG TPA: glycosyltransferase, partial [Armatimonadota bacterium]|nr:glycosyltransferase [Armatimonadota bacterium]
RVRAAIRLAGLGEYVTWLGEVDLAGKLALLRGCSAFCQPSRAPEARGMAALEAMACAAPVIAPDAGIFPEVRALTGLGRLFTPGDPDHLAHACAAVMDDLVVARQAALDALPPFAAHFSAARMADDVLAAMAPPPSRTATT